MSTPKDHFYKYYTYEGLKATLANSARLWLCAKDLQEPVGGHINVKWEFGGLQEIIMACLRKHRDSRALGIDYQRFLDKMTAGTLQPDKFIRDLKAAFNSDITQLRPRAFICCLTHNRHSLPMWTAYAANHTGGVIKFGNFEKTRSPLLEAQKVTYQNHRPKCKLIRAIEAHDDSCIREALRQLLLTKAKDWEYEEEWRAVHYEPPGAAQEAIAHNAGQIELGRKLIPFAKEEITAIYLGAAMPQIHIDELITLASAKYPWAEIYQARPQAKELALTFDCLKSWQRELPLNP